MAEPKTGGGLDRRRCVDLGKTIDEEGMIGASGLSGIATGWKLRQALVDPNQDAEGRPGTGPHHPAPRRLRRPRWCSVAEGGSPRARGSAATEVRSPVSTRAWRASRPDRHSVMAEGAAA